MRIPRTRRFPYKPIVKRLGDIADPCERSMIGARIFGKRFANLVADDATRASVLSFDITNIPKGYAQGGIISGAQRVLVGKEGPEVVIAIGGDLTISAAQMTAALAKLNKDLAA